MPYARTEHVTVTWNYAAHNTLVSLVSAPRSHTWPISVGSCGSLLNTGASVTSPLGFQNL